MALPESELRVALKAVGAFIEKRRPPVDLRSKVDLRVDIINSEILIVEIRPNMDDLTTKRDFPIARLRWFRSRQIWRLFWMRSNLKWQAYEPYPEASKVSTHLRTIDEDVHGCFFG